MDNIQNRILQAGCLYRIVELKPGERYDITNLPPSNTPRSVAEFWRHSGVRVLNVTRYDPKVFEPICDEADLFILDELDEETYDEKRERYLKGLPTWQCQQHLTEILCGTSPDWLLYAVQADSYGCGLMVVGREPDEDGKARIMEFDLPSGKSFNLSVQTEDGAIYNYYQLQVKDSERGEWNMYHGILKNMPNGTSEPIFIEESSKGCGRTQLIIPANL